MGLVSGLSLANHFDLESFLVAHALFSQDGCQQGGYWDVLGHVVSPFDKLQPRVLQRKITADGDCSHEIKRRLLLARKVMTNLDSIFKSRDIPLPTKVRLVGQN